MLKSRSGSGLNIAYIVSYYKKNSKTVEASNFFCLTDFNPTVEKSIERSVCKGKMA